MQGLRHFSSVVSRRGTFMMLLIVWAASSCGVPILHVARGHGVFLKNSTDIPVVLYELGRERRDVGVHRLEPGQEVGSSWAIPARRDDPRRAKVEAEDVSGNLIFRRCYSWDDLEELSWRVEVVREIHSCD